MNSDSDEDIFQEEEEDEDTLDINKFYMALVYRYNPLINGRISLNKFQNIDDFCKVKNGYICAYRLTKKQFMEYDFDLINYDSEDVFIPYIQIIKIEHINFQEFDKQEYYSTAILKTHYLRIIQRKWKRLYKEKLQRMRHPNNIQHRMITGKWPNSCRYCLY